MQEHEITSVIHDGWKVSVRVARTDPDGNMSGSVEIFREDVARCRIVASELFQSREQLTAVLIAKADRWIAAQSGFGPLN